MLISMKDNRYCKTIVFNGKKFVVFIMINDKQGSDNEYHYDIELRTTERISGDEFQKLRKYLQDEGYIDDAVEYYENDKQN